MREGLTRTTFVGLVLLTIMSAVWGQPVPAVTLREYFEARLAERVGNRHPSFLQVCDIDSDQIANRVFREYGAIFAASDDVVLPSKCIFKSEIDLATFQRPLKIKSAMVAGVKIELQEAAMDALLDAIDEIHPRRITPLDGTIAGRRGFGDTLRIWNSRFIPGLNYWVSRGRISRPDADEVMAMPITAQVAKVVEWESRGMYFSTNRTRSIFSSVAPPGTSQHLSLLAFDVQQDSDRTVREGLNRHGWYQTVIGDTPHFTYIGVPESELTHRGLISVVKNGYKFWIPKIR